jgi:hypothetical protein
METAVPGGRSRFLCDREALWRTAISGSAKIR